MDTNVMDDEDLIVLDNTSQNLDEDGGGSHGSDFVEQDDIDTGINITDADTSHSDFVINPLIDPIIPVDDHLGFKDHEQTSGIRYVAEGNTGEELEKLREDLERAEQEELDALPKSNILFAVIGAIAYFGFM